MLQSPQTLIELGKDDLGVGLASAFFLNSAGRFPVGLLAYDFTSAVIIDLHFCKVSVRRRPTPPVLRA